MPDIILGEFSTDITPPEVTNNTPTGIGVVKTSYVEFDITDTETGVDLVSLVVTVDGNLAYDGGGGGFQVGYDGPASAITGPISGTYHVVVDPTSDFLSYAHIDVTVDAQDLAPSPNIMEQFVWGFDVEDYEPPYVDNNYPTGLSVPVNTLITFDIHDIASGVDLTTVIVRVGVVEAYNWDGIGVPNDGFKTGFQGPSSAITGTASDYHFVIDAEADYDEGTVYEEQIEASDFSGNAMLMFSWDFETALYPPTITAQNPAPDATGVDPGQDIYFELDDDSSGINIATIQCDVHGLPVIVAGAFVSGYSGSIVPDGTGRGYDVTINTPPPSYKYGVLNSIRVQVSDFAGSAIDTTWTFSIAKPFPDEWSVLYGPVVLSRQNVTHASLATNVLVNHSTHCHQFAVNPGGSAADFERYLYAGGSFNPLLNHSIRIFFRRNGAVENYPQLTLLARFANTTDCYAVTYRSDMGGGDLLRLGRGVTANYELAAEAVSGSSSMAGSDWSAIRIDVAEDGGDIHIQVYTVVGYVDCDNLDVAGEPVWVKRIDCYHRSGNATPEISGGFGTVIGTWGSITPLLSGDVGWAICPGSTPDFTYFIVVDTIRMFQWA